jgi:hypothetical protein
MTTIYQRLSPLGFAEWLSKNTDIAIDIAMDECELADLSNIESTGRTSLNALAFRWLREEKGIDCYPFRGFYDESDFFYATVYIDNKKISDEKYDTHPLAEIACLEKAAEIIEQDNNEN